MDTDREVPAEGPAVDLGAGGMSQEEAIAGLRKIMAQRPGLEIPALPRYPSLAAALAAFQATRPTLTKTATAKVPGKEGKQGYTYGYANLDDVEEVVLPGFGAVGLAWTSYTTFHGQQFMLVCSLMHESGEARESVFPLPNPNNPQALGSAMTYFKRYALMAASGVSAGEDDDGAAATQAGQRRGEDRDEPRRERMERPEPGRGTRQGAANEHALALATAPIERLPEIWAHVEVGGFVGDSPTEQTAAAIRAHFASKEIPPESEPGMQAPMATGKLAQIAAYRLILAGWQAENFGALETAVAADKAYMALASQQPNFGGIKLSRASGGARLGDWLGLIAANLHRQRNSDPEQVAEPPFVVNADPPYGRQESTPDISTVGGPDVPYDVEMEQTHGSKGEFPPDAETPWYDADDAEDNGRPAVLEGQE